MVTRAIENAQKRVEGHNFDIRKQLLEYDDVMNKQRTVIYNRRREVLFGEQVKEDLKEIREEQVDEILGLYCPESLSKNGIPTAFWKPSLISLISPSPKTNWVCPPLEERL